MKNTFKLAAGLAVLCGAAFLAAGCGTVPKGASAAVQVGAARLEASGAGIVKADAQFTTYRIKCAVCGYVSEEITVPTPQAGRPYTYNWVCPECGHKQVIVIKAV